MEPAQRDRLVRVDHHHGTTCVTIYHTNLIGVIEFKEIRKEWKARKKEEENQRKAEDDRARANAAPADGQNANDGPAGQGYQQGGRSVQLPPIGYQPGSQVPGQYQAPAGGVQQLQEYSGNHMQQYSGYPASPYGAPNQMYNQRHYTPFSPLSCPLSLTVV